MIEFHITHYSPRQNKTFHFLIYAQSAAQARQKIKDMRDMPEIWKTTDGPFNGKTQGGLVIVYQKKLPFLTENHTLEG